MTDNAHSNPAGASEGRQADARPAHDPASRARGAPAGRDPDARTLPLVQRLDRTMAEHPWYPRVIPFLVYIAFLALTTVVSNWAPVLYTPLYVAQCGLVVWLLWRYRRLLPELTLSFHWLALPVGVAVFFAWVWIGMAIAEYPYLSQVGIAQFTSDLLAWMVNPADAPAALQRPDGSHRVFVSAAAASDSIFHQMPAWMIWPSLILRLAGMALVVPLFEELFIRSLLLRSLSSAKNTGIGLVQVAQDFPVVGEWLMNTKLGRRADEYPPMFEHEFKRVPLGKLTMFGVFASTLIFTLNHTPRDYAACVFCGIAYCLLLWATRHKGLGPVCWAHGITNALLWLYTLHTADFRFL